MATYYVDPTSGDNANDGSTEALAFATIAYANTQSTTGDTIQIVAGTHTVTTLTMDEPRIYAGTLNEYGELATTLDFNGAFTSGAGASSVEAFGASDFLLKDIKIIGHNTTDNNLWRYPFGNDANGGADGWSVTLRNVDLSDWNVGNTTGVFTGSIFHYRPTTVPMTFTLDRCKLWDIRLTSGATFGGIISMNQKLINFEVLDSRLVFTPSSGSQMTFVLTTNTNQSTNAGVKVRNSVLYSTAGSIAVADNQTSGLDLNHADNIFFGTYTDAGALTNVLTSDPQFISIANGNLDFRPDITPVENAGNISA